MNYLMRIVAATISLATIGQAQAQTEGNGEPFVFRAPAQVMQGSAVIADNGSESYPTLTGRSVFLPAATTMAAAMGSEAPVQSANSLPRGFQGGTIAFVQQLSVERWASTHQPSARVVQK